jgi:sugar/nucleoside kinase (ribokinase family)
MSEQVYDVLYIGNYTKDTIISPAGTKYVDGGAVNYAAHAAASLGMHVAVVTRLAHEDDRVVKGFEEDGIDCYATYTPSSTLMQLEYPTNDPDLRTLSVRGTAGSITAADVKDLKAKAAVIGPSIRGEVGLDVIKALKDNGILVAADMQGYVRVLRGIELKYEPWLEMAEYLSHVDIVKSDAVEAEALTHETDHIKAARFYADMGPKEIVLTHRDGVLIHADGNDWEFGFFPEQLSGRSGRGDTCVGTYTAMRLSKPPCESGMWAAAVTSLKMERLGPFNRPISEVEAFIHAKYNHGSICK